MSEMAWIRPVVAGPQRGFSSEAGFYTSVQEKIPFPMLFRLHMRIYVESHNLDSAASIGGRPHVRLASFHELGIVGCMSCEDL